MMHRLLLELPNQIETDRLLLRSYHAGDGDWYYAMSMRNQEHLKRYEAKNPVMTIKSVEDAEIVVRDFSTAWVGRQYFFMGAFLKGSQTFTAQITIGPVNWDLPDFEIGYFVDQGHEGAWNAMIPISGASMSQNAAVSFWKDIYDKTRNIQTERSAGRCCLGC
jgi:ribosomal-protein-serine acetyltransferase